MEGRRYGDGLHQAIEAKEKVEIQSENQTLASITYQNYFRLNKKLSCMTGTALTEAEEFFDIYKLNVISIPTHKKMIREDFNDQIFRTEKEKNFAILKKVEECNKKGQKQQDAVIKWAESQCGNEKQYKDAKKDVRNSLARNMYYAWYKPFFDYGVIHGDPHLGNYSVQDDLSINLYDFGCMRIFKSKFIKGVIDLYFALQNNDEALAVHAYEQWGFDDITKDKLKILSKWANFLYAPLMED